MINETHASGRIVKAALDLAAERPWQDIALRDIADRADVPLAELRNDFSGKPAILAKFMRLVDDTVLARGPARDDEPHHDDDSAGQGVEPEPGDVLSRGPGHAGHTRDQSAEGAVTVG